MSSEALGTVTGDAEADQGLVPKLRFPEFRDAGAWKEWPLASLAHINPPNSGLPASFAYIDLGVVEDGSLTAINVIERDGAPSRAQRVLQSGDVLFQMVRPYQRNNLLFDRDDADFVASTGYAQLRSKGPAQFLYQIIHADYFVDRVIGKCTGSNYPAINSSDLAAIFVVVPEHAEQQKIADCLSSLDELIAAEGERLAALRDYKKGLMQQLFPHPERIKNGEKIPAETTPRLRFPEFRDAGEWEWTTVDAIAEIFKGKGISKADVVADGQRPCVRYGELYTTYGEVIDEVTSRTNVAKRDLFMSRANDVIIPSSGETKIDIATAACVLRDDIALGGDLNVIRSTHDGTFLSYFFNGPLKYSIAKVAQGDSVVHLYPSQIGSLTIAVPSADEQKRIADTMFAVDRVLVERRHQIAALKAHKSGLMQQLFPSPAERGA